MPSRVKCRGFHERVPESQISQDAEPDVRIGGAVQDLNQRPSVHTYSMPGRGELPSPMTSKSVVISPEKSV